MQGLDVLYMTRIQRERFQNPSEYRKLKGIYVLDTEKMKRAEKDMIILHPLPRVDEISPEVDKDPRAWYFEQAKCGVFARMALIIGLLGLEAEDDKFPRIHIANPIEEAGVLRRYN
jgi:aspartate carbamoyltransferase catalytic subunit